MNSLTLLNKNQDIQQNIIFKIGKNHYALPLLNVLEIMELPHLDAPQNSNSNVIGLLNFNNILTSIIDIRLIFHEEITQYTTNNKVIMAKTDETIFGIIVDEIENISELSNTKIENFSVKNEKSIIESTYVNDNETIYLLNIYTLENIVKISDNTNEIKTSNMFPNDETSLEIFHKRAINLFERFNNIQLNNVFTENKFVTFLLDKTTYCMKLEYAKEFIHGINITPLPCAPDYLEGLMLVKGDFVTILNLKKFLNYHKTDYSQKSKVIIINSENYKLGLLVDDIYEILNIPEENIQINETNSDNNFLSEEFIDNRTVKPILDIEKLLRDSRLYIDEN